MVRVGRLHFCVRNAAPIVGSLFSWKSLLTKRITREDFPTAASPSSTSLTLLLGLGCAEASAMVKSCEGSDSNFAGYVVADEVP